eukprot:14907377-Alexandrium_andersonii.AAC.1
MGRSGGLKTGLKLTGGEISLPRRLAARRPTGWPRWGQRREQPTRGRRWQQTSAGHGEQPWPPDGSSGRQRSQGPGRATPRALSWPPGRSDMLNRPACQRRPQGEPRARRRG